MLEWWRFAFAASQMAIEAQEVVALRLARIGRGDAAASFEAQKMIAEKSMAMGEAWLAAASAAAHGGDAGRVASAFLRPYRKRVHANRRRLGRASQPSTI